MNTPDLINGLFELIGSIALGFNIYRTWQDGGTRGINFASMFYFTSWGYWNLFFYPHNGLWLSFWGGVLVVLTNTIWFIQALFYNQRKDKPST